MAASLAFTPMPGVGIAADRPDARRVNSPDLIRQLAEASTAHTVVCSVLDTDPAVPFHAAVVADAVDAVMAGLATLAAAVGERAKVIVAADPDGPAWQPLRSAVPKRARLVPVHADYPQADPSLLLFTLLRRRLRPGQLPTRCGAVLVDAAAAADVGDPTADVRIAVRDHFARRTHLLRVPAGSSVGEVLRFAGVDASSATIRAGDFLRDQFVAPTDPTTHAGERQFHVTARTMAANPDPCVRCGWCVEACPTRVHPAGLLDAAQRADYQMADRYGLAGCIECGICTYVCPTRLPLLASIRGLRTDRP